MEEGHIMYYDAAPGPGTAEEGGGELEAVARDLVKLCALAIHGSATAGAEPDEGLGVQDEEGGPESEGCHETMKALKEAAAGGDGDAPRKNLRLHELITDAF
ncbi:hypothetical protein U9M48_032211 [Paspalum notatum var. saurae]|uniref:Uncharacterized protein n=1 Tax=Paspalum notatum var. saurae TaxID=547442 RepID=A0AAQ3U5G5_PASNO